MAGFTARVANGAKWEVSCRGLNHRDFAVLGTCDGCYATVAKNEGGKTFDSHTAGQYMTETYYCWRSHRCDPEAVARNAAAKAEKIASGEIVKGATVEVVAGRKVPKGTVGTVIWVGEDNWGKGRLGIKDAEGTVHWTASTNVAALVTA